ncbi:hypothetical protein [Prolixibacter denitrificans]|nr:hypothetical protein [Prolixibacter denitrificans]
MKKALYFRQKFILIFLGMMALFFIPGCQDEIFEPENVETSTLKNGVGVTPANGTLSSGALYDIQLPASWNNSTNPKILLVYAHGYVDFDKPVALPDDSIPNGAGGYIPISYFVTNALEMGYATTSYRDNGLIVPEAKQDILLLRTTIAEFFITNATTYDPPNGIVLVGPSEGGLITVLTVEDYPELFSAAVATCCPIGNFYDQLQYYGDAHVLFKYFFGPSIKGIYLGSPRFVPKRTIQEWNNGTLPAAIIEVLSDDYLNNNGNKINQFLDCSGIPADRTNPQMVIRNILDVMRFAIKATNDAVDRLHGNPFNNKFPRRIYEGSDNDRKLNLTVERIKTPDWGKAVQTLNNHFETSGILDLPLITIHGQYDHIALVQQEVDYYEKAYFNPPSSNYLTPVVIPDRYGHCNFTASEIAYWLQYLVQN